MTETVTVEIPPTSEPFYWGVSSSAYQTEEGFRPSASGEAKRFATDWDLYAEAGRLRRRKGEATRSYSRVERDVAALVSLGVSHYRFGIEWARVEPRPGQFDEGALLHYLRLARSLRAASITPVVCLWHFTFPDWLSDLHRLDRHGFFHPEMRTAFARYVARVADLLVDEVAIFAPLNEPNTHALTGYLAGAWPPMARLDLGRFRETQARAAALFIDAASLLRARIPSARILTIVNAVDWQPERFDPGGWFASIAREFNEGFLDAAGVAADWIGFSYYFREVASPLAPAYQWLRKRRAGRAPEGPARPSVSDLGWQVDPGGLHRVLRGYGARYKKPLIVMENGIADARDALRADYIRQHARACLEARAQGLDVRGYFHWTLVDNFEWAEGMGPAFGLYALDPETFDLVEKPSADVLRRLARGEASETMEERVGATRDEDRATS